MISYARNLEDVMLQRALGDVENGCYVDVGASHPVIDSTTYALYERGWRGICIEPLNFAELWSRERSGDVFVNAAAGRRSGQSKFYLYCDSAELCTCSDETVDSWKKDGRAPDLTMVVPALALNDVLEQHLGGRTIHLVSIDVEGMEKEVLLGLDLGKYRPWVILVEAVLPGAPVASHHDWEPMILDAGYSMVYFDGVNRFYLARERRELSERFALPPNVWDRFVTAADRESQRRIAELEATVRRLTEEIAATRAAAPRDRGLLSRLTRARERE